MKRKKSTEHFELAKKFMPGGVSSPVRAYRLVGGVPPFISRANGSHVWDVDGHEYIDYVGTWGPAILGHAHPKVLAALVEAMEDGWSFGAPTEVETKLAAMVCQAVPSIEMVRFVNSGTEATMSALRLARGATKRPKVIKFEGCYHGHSDHLLVKAGSGAASFGVPSSAGITEDVIRNTAVCRFNDLDQVKHVMSKEGKNVAAVIVEPAAGNMGCVPPAQGFLEGLRSLTKEYGALLIFDEVMTGFRLAFGGAQEFYEVIPDLTCLGKILGGGLPVGAYGGSRELMEQVAPQGPVYQAGTLSGNPLAMTAGIKTIELLSDSGAYERLDGIAQSLVDGMDQALKEYHVPHQLNRIGSMWSLFFTDQPVTDFLSATRGDCKKFRHFFHAMLDAGIYMAPSPFESAFVSLAHSERDITKTVEAVESWASGYEE
jgi:glutamate-1-semialdehyde 2,1-aminomutase